VSLWSWIVSILVWLSADPAAPAVEHAKAAAAVSAARAILAAPRDPSPPAPGPESCVCGGTCEDGYWKPDGRIRQPCPCPADCPCKAVKCPDGKCVLREKK
jgi:hypothetical protein